MTTAAWSGVGGEPDGERRFADQGVLANFSSTNS
jgi:hypothetical protein